MVRVGLGCAGTPADDDVGTVICQAQGNGAANAPVAGGTGYQGDFSHQTFCVAQVLFLLQWMPVKVYFFTGQLLLWLPV